MRLSSSAFQDGAKIPKLYTGEGRNASPSMEWSQAPSQAKSFVIIMEDPDAPKGPGKDHPFVHWLAYDIPAHVHFLPEGLATHEELFQPVHCKQGKNSFGNIGYDGPMPPEGHGIHDYLFTLHALDTELELAPGATKEELLQAMENHIFHSTKLIGSYERGASAGEGEDLEDEEDLEETRKAV